MLTTCALTACIPNTVTLSLGAESSALRTATVMTDEGSSEGKVALIHVGGVINDLIGAGSSPVDALVTRLDMAKKDARVKAVVLRINSPGGSVSASDEMYNAIRRFSGDTGKPVVASFGEVAASGGYYIALAADHIVAQPTTITGSIGVIIPNVNVSTGLIKLGVYTNNIVSGPNKAMGDPLSPPDLEHEELFQGLVDSFYTRFRSLVVDRRSSAPKPIDAARTNELTDGRVVTGHDAHSAGLVDSMGSIHEAFGVAKALAGMERATLIVYHTKPNAFRPRSPYACVQVGSPRAASHNTQLQLGSVMLPIGVSNHAENAPLQPGVAYYLWPIGVAH